MFTRIVEDLGRAVSLSILLLGPSRSMAVIRLEERMWLGWNLIKFSEFDRVSKSFYINIAGSRRAASLERPSPRCANMFQKNGAEMVSNGVIAKRLLNVREAAQYLGIEVDTVYKKSRLREVPCVKVGRSLRFDVKALERYIEQHSIETID